MVHEPILHAKALSSSTELLYLWSLTPWSLPLTNLLFELSLQLLIQGRHFTNTLVSQDLIYSRDDGNHTQL